VKVQTTSVSSANSTIKRELAPAYKAKKSADKFVQDARKEKIDSMNKLI